MVETIAIVSAIVALVIVASWTPIIIWIYFNNKTTHQALQVQLDQLKATTTALANHTPPSEERLQAVEGKLTALQMQRR